MPQRARLHQSAWIPENSGRFQTLENSGSEWYFDTYLFNSPKFCHQRSWLPVPRAAFGQVQVRDSEAGQPEASEPHWLLVFWRAPGQLSGKRMAHLAGFWVGGGKAFVEAFRWLQPKLVEWMAILLSGHLVAIAAHRSRSANWSLSRYAVFLGAINLMI